MIIKEYNSKGRDYIEVFRNEFEELEEWNFEELKRERSDLDLSSYEDFLSKYPIIDIKEEKTIIKHILYKENEKEKIYYFVTLEIYSNKVILKAEPLLKINKLRERQSMFPLI